MKEEYIDASPALRLDRPGEETERDRVASADEIQRLWAAYDELGYPHGAHAKLMLLTAQRFGEVASMKWRDIGEDGWRLPAAAAKTKVGHLVPLSTLAREVLAGVPQIGEYVFRGRLDRPLQSSSKVNARLYELAQIEDWEPEDSRRTGATHMRSLGVDKIVVSKILNHAEGGVTKVYDRWSADPEKIAGLERWANKLREIAGSAPARSTVTQFAKRGWRNGEDRCGANAQFQRAETHPQERRLRPRRRCDLRPRSLAKVSAVLANYSRAGGVLRHRRTDCDMDYGLDSQDHPVPPFRSRPAAAAPALRQGKGGRDRDVEPAGGAARRRPAR